MSWTKIIYDLVQQNKFPIEKLNTAITKGYITGTDKIQILASLLNIGYIAESDLDTYITNTWLTTEEKAAVLNETNFL